MSTQLEAALAYLKRGFSVIPAKPDKLPYLESWKEFQEKPASEAQVRAWWGKWPDANIAVICGPVSDLIVLDTDSGEAWEWCQERIPDGLAVPVVRTPTVNRQLYFKYRPGLRSKNNVVDKVDLKTTGGYVIAPPSRCRYQKNGQAISGAHAWGELLSLDDLPTPDMPDMLFDDLEKALAYSFDTEGSKQGQQTKDTRPGDDYNARATDEDIVELLELDGWQVQKRLHDRIRLTRPGKDPRAGHSATLFLGGPFYPFSTEGSKHFKSYQSYSRFAIYANVVHDGDFNAATKALAAKGYSKKATTPSATAAPDFAGVEPYDFFGDPLLTGKPEWPQGACPRVIDNFARDEAERIGVDTAMVGIPAIGMATIACSDNYKIQPKANDHTWREDPRLWFAVIAEPGQMKTPSIKAAKKPLAQIAYDHHLAHTEALARYAEESKAWQEIKDTTQPPPSKPIERRFYTDDVTIEGLRRVLEENHQGIGIIKDELSGWITSFDIYKSGGKQAGKQGSG